MVGKFLPSFFRSINLDWCYCIYYIIFINTSIHPSFSYYFNYNIML
ncbi:hypothetical protein MCHI_002829 [Candidatus Magnetoovum chiemensis]|nr:hypothetical protein MCHI_002829 [Candidatus Magnetoovum chiemensis]